MMSGVLQTAISLRGLPYQFGGDRPDTGFDCSGFVRYVFGQSRLTVPRTVDEQFHAGHAVDRDHPSAGDLIFFSTTGPGATHVGIVLDADARTFVHAPGTGSVVRVDRFDTPYWRSRTLGLRRLTAARASTQAVREQAGNSLLR
jgi:cell wall-associated NlpC family hydrolase